MHAFHKIIIQPRFLFVCVGPFASLDPIYQSNFRHLGFTIQTYVDTVFVFVNKLKIVQVECKCPIGKGLKMGLVGFLFTRGSAAYAIGWKGSYIY